MQELSIVPHVGIGPIKLGASRDALHLAMAEIGLPFESSNGALDYFADASIQIEYDDEGSSEFVGVSCHRDYTLTYFGTNVFDTTAEEVFALVAAREQTAHSVFDPSGHIFPEQIITLWEADEQYDRLGGKQRVIWAQIGLGNRRYLEAVRAIDSHSS